MEPGRYVGRAEERVAGELEKPFTKGRQEMKRRRRRGVESLGVEFDKVENCVYIFISLRYSSWRETRRTKHAEQLCRDSSQVDIIAT